VVGGFDVKVLSGFKIRVFARMNERGSDYKFVESTMRR